MTFDIRPASLFDLNSLQKLEHACFQNDAWPIFDLVAVLTFANVIRLKAVINNRMVGFIAGDPKPSENMAWIATLGVMPEYQNQGIGKELLRTCEEQLHASRIRLCVRPGNLAALELYRQSGYLTIDRWMKYYNDGGEAIVMEKVI